MRHAQLPVRATLGRTKTSHHCTWLHRSQQRLREEIYDPNWRVGQIGHVGHVEPIISRNGMLYQDHGCQRFHNGERELVANNTEIKILH